ncbi:UNVERIFIED_CONTAM: hypothetical protein K2H54_038952 [Gekko kuhli]
MVHSQMTWCRRFSRRIRPPFGTFSGLLLSLNDTAGNRGGEVGTDETEGRTGVDVGTGVGVDIEPSGRFRFGDSADESDHSLGFFSDLLLSLNDTAEVVDCRDDFPVFVGLMRLNGNNS